MKIAIVDTLGLCYDGSTLNKRGLGGSESAVIYMSKELSKLGFEVTVFNDCESDDAHPGFYDKVEFLPLRLVEKDTRKFDVIIGSRSVATFAPPEIRNQFKTFSYMPDFTNLVSKARYKVLWMHDTFCDGDNLIEDFILQGRIDEIFTLSDWHTSYISTCNHGKYRNFDILKNHIFETRNGIGNKPEWVDISLKDPNLFVYNSSVTKGMVPLVTKIWPVVKNHIPQAKLKVIGGYYKFRENSQPDQQEQDWRKLVEEYSNLPLDIDFTGIITQSEISNILSQASYMIYPSAFPETFGISTLEALAHNVPIITCRFGALEETALDIASYKIPYTMQKNWSCDWLNEDSQIQNFINMTLNAYFNKYLHQQKMYACNQIKDICTWDSIALQWKQHLFHKLGEYLQINEYRKVKKINSTVRKVFGRRFLNKEELVENKQSPYNHIDIITPVYNAEKYIRKCILSVAQQDYGNYRMTIIDDCSTDKTVSVINDTLNNLPKDIRSNFKLIQNKSNKGAVYNQIKAIEKTGDTIIMLLDGDDWLINDPTIFDKYNNIYNDGAEFTYGSCWSVCDNIPLIAQEYPPEIKKNELYRNYKFNWNMPYTHLRTFKSILMHSHIHLYGMKAFKYKDSNDWLKAGGDTSVFYTMIEMADPDKVICIPDLVYCYNDSNPLNDYKVNSQEQNSTAKLVMSRENND